MEIISAKRLNDILYDSATMTLDAVFTNLVNAYVDDPEGTAVSSEEIVKHLQRTHRVMKDILIEDKG